MEIYKLFVNVELNENERAWEAQNGATRRTLVIVNKTGKRIIPDEFVFVNVGTLDKGNHSFIFLNNPVSGVKTEAEVLGLFLNKQYGYKCLNEEDEIYAKSSVGGYGNSESKMGLYKLGAIIKVNTYKNRRGYHYYKLTENGWKYLGQDVPLEEKEIKYL